MPLVEYIIYSSYKLINSHMTKGSVYKIYEKLDETITKLKNSKLTPVQKSKIKKGKKKLINLLNKK
ncbi:MAG: hypothetical protein COX81_03470 [Candidatus Magasanikbacteria bacterium CG_4_10_14_0_2_um_filter_37_12]|uniref:Uncharacterized protein n=1 Tax=Candidatus Magasanikbacteria bacterium CG_4_10_14_0_2_um_filter_37_12 TaxID=1974637 RepID=A0A2M7V739_9BACT|nr:MAG: hypothetical protein COX81_03470 [Candidatus Magasanikbacteria bacterium CG_4_10_14_0_2_um_filter_37_12]